MVKTTSRMVIGVKMKQYCEVDDGRMGGRMGSIRYTQYFSLEVLVLNMGIFFILGDFYSTIFISSICRLRLYIQHTARQINIVSIS